MGSIVRLQLQHALDSARAATTDLAVVRQPSHVTGPCGLGTVHHSRPCSTIQYVTLLSYPIRGLVPHCNPNPIRGQPHGTGNLSHMPYAHQVATGQCDVLEKVRSLDSIGGDMPCDVPEGRGWCCLVYPELR